MTMIWMMRKKICISALLIVALFRFADIPLETKEVLYLPVTVTPGDTLWDIAAAAASDKEDIREVIYHIQSKNNMKLHESVQPGQVLFVPVEKERFSMVAHRMQQR